MNGYALIARSSANICGVLSAPSYPVLTLVDEDGDKDGFDIEKA